MTNISGVRACVYGLAARSLLCKCTRNGVVRVMQMLA